jgi:hypothetical protein
MTDQSSLFRKATAPVVPRENPYEAFGLEQNPFPAKPSVVPGSDDPRLNGSIYRADLRQQEEQTFERLMIPTLDHPDVRSIVLLMDFATRRGRGIGKTAFLNYQRRRITADLGDALTGGAYVLFAAYVLPPTGGRCRKFWQFAQLLAKELNEQGIVAQAIWRLRAFSGCIPAEVLARVDEDFQATIGNNEWLAQQGINVMFGLDPAVTRILTATGMRPEIAESLARSGHSPKLWHQDFLSRQTDYRWRQDSGRLVFDDLVCLCLAAEFTRGLLLVDEVEKIIIHQSTKERRAFVEDIRYFLLDGPHRSARSGFYQLLLTIHPYVQELLAPHWSAAGLDRFCALSGELTPEYTIYFGPLDAEAAVPLVTVYLDRFRPPDRQGELTPFDEDAVVEALRLANGVPGPMLSLLHRVIERAVVEEWKTIGADQVRTLFKVEPPAEPEVEELDRELPSVKVDLLAED